MRRAKQLSLIVAIITAIGGCGGGDSSDDPTGPSDDGIPGTYVLKTLNGAALPGIYKSDASSRTWLDTATIRLTSSNTFSDVRTTRAEDITGVHTTTVARTGQYAVNGTTISLSYANAFGTFEGAENGTLVSKTLTKVEGGVTLTFRK